METSIRRTTGGKGRLGLTKSLGALYQRLTSTSLQNPLPVELFMHGVPYEATRTYRTMKTEFECRRVQAMVEAHRQALRGF